jgi:Fe-Mn family superoxide dismutase
MSYRIAPLAPTPHELDGLSVKLVVSHYENNYGGAVRRLNAIQAELAALDFSKAPVFQINGLKREELIAANSMVLHEIHFDGLGKDGEGPGGALAAALERDFGSLARWQAEFTGMGKALGGGSGWVLLSWFPRQGRLINQWASDHAHGLAGGQPVLALDMYEHAYQMDFGARAAAYVDTWMRNINWNWAGQRFAQVAQGGAAPTALYGAGALPPEALREALAAGAAQGKEPPLLLDVRRRPAFDAGADMLPGALWREPEQVETWAGDLPAGREVLVYCVYGHNVSEDAAAQLRRLGVNARPRLGGLAAWHAMGGPTQARAG